MRTTSHLTNLILCGFFACLTGVFSQIIIPLPLIPINLATLSVMLAGGILGPKWGAVSQLIYVLLGAFGVPVYAQMTAGLAILIGPTGGYILGYVLAAFVTGLLVEQSAKKPVAGPQGRWSSYLPYAASIPACYIPGTIWFMFVTNSNLATALLYCVLPFLVGDSLKILCAAAVVPRVRAYTKYTNPI